MSAFDAIRAQAGPIDILRRAVAGGRVAYSYLFEGPSGVGKQLSAVALAKEVLGACEAAVRRIDAGRRDAGVSSIAFDGLADDGTALPSGVYFYRVTVGERFVTQKLVLTR